MELTDCARCERSFLTGCTTNQNIASRSNFDDGSLPKVTRADAFKDPFLFSPIQSLKDKEVRVSRRFHLEPSVRVRRDVNRSSRQLAWFLPPSAFFIDLSIDRTTGQKGENEFNAVICLCAHLFTLEDIKDNHPLQGGSENRDKACFLSCLLKKLSVTSSWKR